MKLRCEETAGFESVKPRVHFMKPRLRLSCPDTSFPHCPRDPSLSTGLGMVQPLMESRGSISALLLASWPHTLAGASVLPPSPFSLEATPAHGWLPPFNSSLTSSHPAQVCLVLVFRLFASFFLFLFLFSFLSFIFCSFFLVFFASSRVLLSSRVLSTEAPPSFLVHVRQRAIKSHFCTLRRFCPFLSTAASSSRGLARLATLQASRPPSASRARSYLSSAESAPCLLKFTLPKV